jgi:hypothetical protein
MATEPTSPLKGFLRHQRNALEETGKAFAALFPKDFRSHTSRALEESKTSFEVLFEGVIDGMERGLDKLRCSKEDAPDEGKVKVEVE